MVLIQLNINNEMSRFLKSYSAVNGIKNQREAIRQILEEKKSNEKELMKVLKRNSVEA